jgi:hypothetical protein
MRRVPSIALDRGPDAPASPSVLGGGPGGGEGRAAPGFGASMGRHDALEDGSLTAALLAAGAIKLAPLANRGGSPTGGGP